MNSAEREAKREEIKKHTREFLLRKGVVNMLHPGARRVRVVEPEQSIAARKARLRQGGGESEDKGTGVVHDS